MKIVSLSAENFKRLTAIQIDPKGNLVEITGDNTQGKSSILDAIWAAIGGKAAGPAKPVRVGEEVAIIRVDLGDLKITRKFIKKDDGHFTTSLTVENNDGHRLSPPQEILNKLTSTLSFDPLEFARKQPKDQAVMLRALVPDFDFPAAEAELAKLMTGRTEIGRELKQARAEADAAPIAEDAPAELMDTAALIETINQAMNNNLNREREQAAREKTQADIDEAREQASDLRSQIETLTRKIKEAVNWADAQQTTLDTLPPLDPPADVDTLKQTLTDAQAHNDAFKSAERARELGTKVESLEKRYKVAGDCVDAKRAAMLQAVRNANLPVDGLSFDEAGVYLNNLPYEQASQAEQLRTAIAVAVALDPKLRVLRVKDGALLGTKAMEQLAAFADQFDMQIWIETVESSRPAAILIEDGTVAVPAIQAAE